MITLFGRTLLIPLAALAGAFLVCGGVSAAPDAGNAQKSYILFVFNNPVDGKEAEYNEWYNHVHAHEVTKELGFDHAQRFVSSPAPMGGETPRRYVVIYSGSSTDIAKSYSDYFVNSKAANQNTPNRPQEIDPRSNYNDSFQLVGPQIAGHLVHQKDAQDYIWLVYANNAPGREDAFTGWFDKSFATQLAKIRGVVSTQAFERTKAQLGDALRVAAPPHLIICKIRTDDIAAFISAAKAKMDSAKSGDADPNSWISYGYKQLGPDIY